MYPSPPDRNVLKLPWVTVTPPDEASLSEVILNPGDILQLPKGTWHRAQASGGSLGLTLAMESASPLELVEFRNALPGYWVQSIQEGMPAELHAQFVQSFNRASLHRRVHDALRSAPGGAAIAGSTNRSQGRQ